MPAFSSRCRWPTRLCAWRRRHGSTCRNGRNRSWTRSPGNLISKWNMPPEKAHHREEELRRHLPEAWVDGFESLIDGMKNDPGDRHELGEAAPILRATENSKMPCLP